MSKVGLFGIFSLDTAFKFALLIGFLLVCLIGMAVDTAARALSPQPPCHDMSMTLRESPVQCPAGSAMEVHANGRVNCRCRP